MRKALSRFLLAIFVFISMATTVLAIPPVGTGWVPIGSGARALGMGNAFTAIADDATAAWWNPAGLAQLEKPELSLVVQSRTLEVTDVRDDGFGVTANFSGSNTTTSMNFGSIVYPFGGTAKGARKAVSLSYGTFLDLNFEATASNGYFSKMKGSFDIVSLTAATEITPSLMVGAGYNTLTGSITEDVNQGGTFNQEMKPSGDFPSIGILYRGKEFSFGAVYRADFQMDIKATGSDNGTPIDRTDIFRYPYSGAAGVSYRPMENLTASFDVQYLNFSKAAFLDSAVEDVVHKRLGLEYLIFTKGGNIIPVRVGYFMGNLGLLDTTGASVDTSGMTLGTGIVFKDFQIDLAYERQSIDGFVHRYTTSPETNYMGETTISRFLISAIYRF